MDAMVPCRLVRVAVEEAERLFQAFRADVTIGRGRQYGFRNGKRKMAAIEDDDKPKKKLAHEIGQDLALLSLKELDERIAVLQDEIARLETARAKKQASRSAADQFFKR